MNELLNTINNIKNNGILTPINIFTKKDENKIIKKILNSDKFKEIYPNTDKEKALSIIKCNFSLLASKEENNNYNHEFLVYDNGGSKEIFLYFEGSRARKWSLENEIIEVQETKTYKDIDNSIVQAATKENKINDLSIDNKIVERANNLIESLEINPGEQAQTYINYLKNKGIDSKDKNNKLVLAARVHLIKYGYFKTDAIAKAAEIEGVKSTKELEQKYFNKLVDILKNGSEEVEPIKEEFYNNNEVEPVAEQTEKENNNYITLTKEQEKERIDLINLWSKKSPGDKEQGKERFLQLLFEYQEKKKTKEEFKKHINKLYAANKNIKAYYAGKKDFNNYLTDLLATEDILQKNDIIKNEFFTNAYNYIKSVS